MTRTELILDQINITLRTLVEVYASTLPDKERQAQFLLSIMKNEHADSLHDYNTHKEKEKVNDIRKY